MKRLAYTSLVRPMREYGASRWDPYRKSQKNALDRVQKKAVKFAKHGKYEYSSHSHPLQIVHRRTGMEIYRREVKRTMPRVQG